MTDGEAKLNRAQIVALKVLVSLVLLALLLAAITLLLQGVNWILSN